MCSDYSDKVGGTDKVDQHLAAYSTPRKRGKKYYKKIFFHLLDLALWNSYIMYYKAGGSEMFKQFRMELIEKLISENHRDEYSAISGKPSNCPSPFKLTSWQFPEVISATEKKKIKTNETVYSVLHKRDSRGKAVWWAPSRNTQHKMKLLRRTIEVPSCSKLRLSSSVPRT